MTWCLLLANTEANSHLLPVCLMLVVKVFLTSIQVKGLIYENMESGMKFYGVEEHAGVTETWDLVQREMECCGTEEYLDWVNTTTSAGENVPDSCCLSKIVGCGLGVLRLTPDKVSSYM